MYCLVNKGQTWVKSNNIKKSQINLCQELWYGKLGHPRESPLVKVQLPNVIDPSGPLSHVKFMEFLKCIWEIVLTREVN
jgi:hypothetical protein